jgi:hypothetical protein
MLIGIVGRARSGKDTFSRMLAEEIFDIVKIRFVLISYANELKLRLQSDFDLSYDQLWGDKKEDLDYRYKKKGSIDSFWTPREIMQFVGTECYRAIDNNFWVKQLFRVIDENEYRHVIITDIRYPDEADPIVERNGYIIKINTSRCTEVIHGSNHSSEISMDDYNNVDFIVENDGSLLDLRNKAKQVVDFLIKSERLGSRTKNIKLEG